MIIISRKKNESIIINDDITIVVVEIRGDKVRLGVECPKEVPFHRNDVYEAVRRTDSTTTDSSETLRPSSSPASSRTNRSDTILQLRDLLLSRRSALQKALDGDLTLLNQLREESGGDSLDTTSDASQNQIFSQLAEVESRELANIELALALFERGIYGECEICHTKIPLARLLALPYATRCIYCQRDAEQCS